MAEHYRPEVVRKDPVASMIAEAMMASTLSMVGQRYLTEIAYPLDETSSLALLHRIRKRTNQQCHDAAINVAYYLWKHYPGSFDAIAMVRSVADELPESELNCGHGDQSYSLLLSQGVWYAATAANFGSFIYSLSKHNPLTTIFADNDLQKVLHSIRMREAGIWPSAENIYKLLETGNVPVVSRIRSKDYFRVPCITHEWDTVFHEFRDRQVIAMDKRLPDRLYPTLNGYVVPLIQ